MNQMILSRPTKWAKSCKWSDDHARLLVRRTGASARLAWRRTPYGDLGYLDEDGDLFIVQRRSDLVISGGENVYPAEVERVLCSHVVVQDAAVLGIADAEWGQRVAAVVQLQSGENTSREALQAYCRTRLASYKLPRESTLLRCCRAQRRAKSVAQIWRSSSVTNRAFP